MPLLYLTVDTLSFPVMVDTDHLTNDKMAELEKYVSTHQFEFQKSIGQFVCGARNSVEDQQHYDYAKRAYTTFRPTPEHARLWSAAHWDKSRGEIVATPEQWERHRSGAYDEDDLYIMAMQQMKEANQALEKIKDEVLESVQEGTSKVQYGWVCAKCDISNHPENKLCANCSPKLAPS